MKTVILGAGALGCFFGARLQQNGHEVTYVARGAHLKAMQRNGLRIESRSGNFSLDHVDATDDLAEVGDSELIFFAVKNYDVEKTMSEMADIVGPETAVMTVQNGVWAQKAMADRFGGNRVLPSAVYLPADIKEPGVIRTSAEAELAGITLGPYEGGTSELAVRVQEAFKDSGVSTTLSEDIWRSLWEKFIRLSAFSAITGSTRLNIGEILKTEATRRLLRSLLEETLAIARASHKTIAEDEGQRAFDFFMQLAPDVHASMLDDLLRGKRIELDWISGEVIRRGRELGIPTPCHEFAYAVLAPFREGRPAGSN